MGFSRQEYWSELPFLSPGDLPDPGIEPWSPALQADSLPSEPPGAPVSHHVCGHLLPNSRKGPRCGGLKTFLLGERERKGLSSRASREGNGNALQCSCLENPMDGGAWWAAVYGVAQSRTRLEQQQQQSK